MARRNINMNEIVEIIYHWHQSPDPYTLLAKGSSFVNKNDREKIWVYRVCLVCRVYNKQRSTDNRQRRGICCVIQQAYDLKVGALIYGML